ncbi:hypothetical protein [Sphingobacterium griseoflavum]|uniref:Uncharacterized protein n=1 Tax=Sphingobacterium griseoflavum TaxID=1474952 RepID=A0ABQ3HS51_9SPHI|nr:hypothetical protein [Sphingobacterium griseoflavum]GHE29411.1 hypothetical protein GCM10017764_10310 [Sphingobacterium griseoflavum]
MKKIILTGIGLLFAITMSFAQSNPEEAAKQEVAVLTEKLTLTEDQQTSVLQIVWEGAKAKAAVKEDATLSPEVLVESLHKIQATTDAQVAEKLSDEQKPVFEKLISERPKETAPIPVEIPEQPTQPEL